MLHTCRRNIGDVGGGGEGWIRFFGGGGAERKMPRILVACLDAMLLGRFGG